ncbi:MAG TPA: TIGR03619 family F420-dependent LLM class oxidoreductase [Nitrososphaeraceae archaeon]|nr:TIGR03619 family F420-dependent LLM class oxidoreductase [Nitrososphaeraceae archaeon]
MHSNSSMKIGLRLPQTGKHNATKENIIHISKEAENAGFDSLWVLERLIWPINPQTHYPGTGDGTFPADWQYIFEPLETLTYVAANTESIALGTSVIDMLFQNPVILARRFATLDVLSQGRAIAGLGIGWSKDEYQASNIPFKDRGTRADEFIEALKKVWTEEVVEFKGKYYNIPASKVGPKPIQKPHIPIYLGGFSPNMFSRIVKYDIDGWLGVVGGPLEYIENSIKTIKEQANKANKDPDNFRIIMLTYPNIAESQSSSNNKDKNRFPLSGGVDEIGSDIQRIKDMGVDHIIFGYNFSPIGKDVDKMMNISKQLSKFAK